MTYPAPYALAQVAIAGAAPVQGGQVVFGGQTVAFSGVNTQNWNTALWELYDYPPGWSAPLGWTALPTGIIQYSGTATSPNPPNFTLPSIGTWGKWGLRLTVNGGIDPTGLGPNPSTGAPNARMVDTTLALSMYSTHLLRDMFVGENSQFGGVPNEQWVRDYKANLRLLEAFLAGGGGGGGGGTTIAFQPVSGPATVAAQPGVTYGCDVTGGAIVFTVAGITGAPLYTKFGVLSWKSDPSVGGHGITVQPPGGGNIQDPENIGTLSATAVALTVKGSGATWFYDGANLVLTA